MSFIILLLFISTTVHSVQFPKNFPKCRQLYRVDDRKRFQDCFLAASETAKPFLIEGLEELGIPSIKDIVIPSLRVEQRTRAYSIVVLLSNVTVSGLENYHLPFLLAEPSPWDLKTQFLLNHIGLEGTYGVDGIVFAQNISQSGHFNATVENTVIDAHVRTETYKKNGTVYARFIIFDIEPHIGTAVGGFDNLFGENVVLNKAVNAFLEESTTSLLETVKPDVKKLLNNIISTLAKTILAKIPWEVVFPKS